MPNHADIGAFLKSCRARITPEQAGLPPGGGYRRVSGLRREELAQLAGISVDYYIRLEQGRTETVSGVVLDAVAAALQLSQDEHEHLHELAKPDRDQPHRSRSQHVRPGLLQLLHALPTTPAFVLGRRTDILAWNSLACALITDFTRLTPTERNLARLVLLDEKVSRLYTHREQAVRNMVGSLRFDAGRHPDDPELAKLVAELSSHSTEFRRHWDLHVVRKKRHGLKQFDHPLLGEFELSYESLSLPDDPDQLLIMYSAEPGSPAETKLEYLADHAPMLVSSVSGDERGTSAASAV